MEKESARLVRRSTLIMPANQKAFVEQAWKRNADAICLDLEDGVAPQKKEEARRCVKQGIALVGRGGGDILVRVNSDPQAMREDLDASIYKGLSGVILTKVEQPSQLIAAEREIARLEQLRGLPAGSLDTTLLIETAYGYAHLAAILEVARRARTLVLGVEDFLLDLGMPRGDGGTLSGARLHVMIMARAYNLEPRGLVASISEYSDPERSYRLAQESYCFGYRGATCIHPAQVEPYNRGFSPDGEEIEEARRIWAVFEEAQTSGRGAVGLHGKMIDIPIAMRAYNLLCAAKAIANMEERKRLARLFGG